jgi:RND family efflux transporter MFP subunit
MILKADISTMQTQRHNIIRRLSLSTMAAALTASAIVGCNPAKKPAAGTGSAGAQGSAAGQPAGASTAGAMKAAAVRAEKKSLVRTTEQPGQIVPLETTPIVAKVAGYVEAVSKDIGDPIKAGETLAVLTAPELQEDVKQKEALVKQAETGIVQAEAGLKVAESAVAKAKALEAELQAGIDRATADQKRWASEYDRIQELSDRGSVTNKLLDETLSKRDAAVAATAEARAKFKSAAAAIAEAESRVVQAQADLEAAKSQKLVAEAARDAAKQMTDYLTIKAPYDGTVTARNIDTGHFVSPSSSGAKPLFVVVRDDRLRIVVGVPEQDAQFVTTGDPATIRVFALGDRPIGEGAKVTRSALTLDHDSGTLRTEIHLDNPKRELRPGLYVTVGIELERRDGVVVLPTSAVFVKDGRPACVVVTDGKAELRFIKKGLTAGPEVEILPSASLNEGVREGEIVVAKNAATIPDGQRLEGVLPTPTK